MRGCVCFPSDPSAVIVHEQTFGETVTGCAGLWADSVCVHGDPPAVVKEPDLTGNRGIWGNIEAAVKEEK